MTWLLILLIAGFALAAATALVRGLFAFYKDGEVLKQGDADFDLRRGMQQNRMMSQRVLFQGLAVAAVALLGVFAAKS
jgi:hypothetical protein